MKRIGLLGGMSWESTAVYYRLVNELVASRLGGLHSSERPSQPSPSQPPSAGAAS